MAHKYGATADSPITVRASSGVFKVGEPPSDANPLPVQMLETGSYVPSEPVSMANPLPVDEVFDVPGRKGEPFGASNPLYVKLMASASPYVMGEPPSDANPLPVYRSSWFKAAKHADMAAIADFNSDTYALPNLGSELVTNGTFDTDLSVWTAIHTAPSTVVWSNGTALWQTDGVNNGWLRQSFATVPGALYQVSKSGVNVQLGVGTTSGGTDNLAFSSANDVRYFVATASVTWVNTYSAINNSTLDNVSVKQVLCGGQPELVKNGTFAADISNWTVTPGGTGTVTWDATGKMAILGDGVATTLASQGVPTVIGQSYTLSGTVVNTQSVRIGTTLNGGEIYWQNQNTGTFSIPFVATAATTYITFGRQSATTATVDNVSVKAPYVAPQLRAATRSEFFSAYTAASTTARSYIDSAGVLKTDLAANAPRFDYANGKRQLLLENAGTNKLTYSHDFTQAYWVKTAITLDANGVTGPFGIASTALVEDATTNTRGIHCLGLSTTAGTSETFYAIVKAGNANWLRMFLDGNGGTNPFASGLVEAYVHIANGASGIVGTGTIATKDLGNGWRLIAWTVTPDTTVSAGVRFGMRATQASGSVTYSGTAGAVACYMAHVQAETSPFWTMPVRTTGAAVTRAIETFRLSPLVEAILQRAEGGAVVRGRDMFVEYGRIVGYGSGAAIRGSAAFGGVTTQMTSGTFSANYGDVRQPFGAAHAFDGTGQALVMNGNTPATSALAPDARSDVHLGRAGGVFYGGGRYDFLGILPSRPSDARLQELAREAGYVAPPPVVAPTFSSTDKHANATISNGNRTATITTGGTTVYAQAVEPKTTGKWIVAFDPGGTISDQLNTWFGLEIDNSSGVTGSSTIGYRAYGQIWSFGSSVGTVGAWDHAASEVLLAVDLDAKKVWAKVGSGDWNLNASADPATGVGGITFSSVNSALLPTFSGSVAGAALTFVTPSIVPSGFSRWAA